MRLIITGDFVPNERVADAFAHGDYSAVEALQPVFAQADYRIVN